MQRGDRKRRMRVGLWVFAGLLALEVVEYTVGVGMKRGGLGPLIVLALGAAWLIARYFMHVQQLRRGEG